MRKILYSPGFGAGWSSWIEAPQEFVCTYQPIIEALERGEKLNPDHPAVEQFVLDCQDKYNTTPYLGGLYDLQIFECEDDDKVRIHEYDGSESVIVGCRDYF